MRALITGACGFVGGHLVKHLMENGDEVLGTVFPGPNGELRRHPFTALPLDVRDAEACARIIAEYRPEVIYHLAGMAFVPESESDFGRTLLTNVGGVDNLYRVCHFLQADIRVVLVSSGEVYGKVSAECLPVNEDVPIAPANNYSLSKAMSELVAQRYARQGHVASVILRPFNHVGPGQDSRFVASNFARQLALIALGRAPARIEVGNLDARRDFSDVRDIVRAYRLAAERGSGIYNLGSGQAVAIRELLNSLLEIAGLEVQVVKDPARMRPSEVPVFYTSYTKAERELGWQPKIELRQTLEDIYRYWLNLGV